MLSNLKTATARGALLRILIFWKKINREKAYKYYFTTNNMSEIFSDSYLVENFEIYPAEIETVLSFAALSDIDAAMPVSLHKNLFGRIYPNAKIYYTAAPIWMQKAGHFIKTAGAEIKSDTSEKPMFVDKNIFEKIWKGKKKIEDSFLIIKDYNFIKRMGLEKFDYS